MDDYIIFTIIILEIFDFIDVSLFVFSLIKKLKERKMAKIKEKMQV